MNFDDYNSCTDIDSLLEKLKEIYDKHGDIELWFDFSKDKNHVSTAPLEIVVGSHYVAGGNREVPVCYIRSCVVQEN